MNARVTAKETTTQLVLSSRKLPGLCDEIAPEMNYIRHAVPPGNVRLKPRSFLVDSKNKTHEEIEEGGYQYILGQLNLQGVRVR